MLLDVDVSGVGVTLGVTGVADSERLGLEGADFMEADFVGVSLGVLCLAGASFAESFTGAERSLGLRG